MEHKQKLKLWLAIFLGTLVVTGLSALVFSGKTGLFKGNTADVIRTVDYCKEFNGIQYKCEGYYNYTTNQRCYWQDSTQTCSPYSAPAPAPAPKPVAYVAAPTPAASSDSTRPTPT